MSPISGVGETTFAGVRDEHRGIGENVLAPELLDRRRHAECFTAPANTSSTL